METVTNRVTPNSVTILHRVRNELLAAARRRGRYFLAPARKYPKNRLKGRYGTKRPLKNPPPLHCYIGWEFGRFFPSNL